MVPIEILEADLDHPAHQRAVVTLLDAYAMDPMGIGKALATDVRRDLIPGLQQHPPHDYFSGVPNAKSRRYCDVLPGFFNLCRPALDQYQ
jgi:hypothetical protein